MKKVLLTGISGYLGQHCAVELLRNGYAVRGSVRNLSKSDEVTKAIQKEIDPKGNLEFCALNLLQDEGWDQAMEGCEYVMHVASPFVSSEPKDENELIKPAVEGTQRALKAAKKAGIKRMVLTSSMVAMIGGKKGDVKVDESSWTDVNAKGVSAYLKSKTLAEKSAWDFIQNQEGGTQLELVTVNPGPIYGPTLSDKISGESMTTYKELISGGWPRLPQAAINMSDVRDVANIHVQALDNPSAQGKRFIVSTENPYSFQEMAQILKDNGYDKVSTKLAPNFLLKFMANFNNDLKGLLPFIGNTFHGDVRDTKQTFQWTPTDFDKTVVDTAKSVEAVLENG